MPRHGSSSASDAAQTLKALSHPLRVQILGALEHEVKSPNELAKLLGAPLGNIASQGWSSTLIAPSCLRWKMS
jgi:DNA-binding transcriptional ArsR family regulator